MLDLHVKNATLPDGRTGMSEAVRAGRIAQVAPYFDLQLVAFPQDGVLRAKGGWRT